MRRAKRRRGRGGGRGRCVEHLRIGWADAIARCTLEGGHPGAHRATRRSANRDAAVERKKRRLTLPVRRRLPSAQPPDEELRERTLRDLTKMAISDAIRATLDGVDGPPEALVHGHRRMLERTIGKLESCRTAQVIQEAGCGIFLAITFSCHVRVCPDCELIRQARFSRIGEALVRDTGGESVCSLLVLTAVNPPFGSLERAKRTFKRDQARLRRTPPFAGGPCPWPGHADTPGFNERGGHRPIPGGFSSDECPPSTRSETWNLHTNWILDSAPYVLRGELSWWWRRMTCTTHRRTCPGTCPCYRVEFDELAGHGVVVTPSCEGRCVQDDRRYCAGGAWDLWIRRLLPGKVREAVKYTTKPTDMVKAGPAAIVEFLIAMRGAKLITRWGSFRGRDLVVDPEEQKLADAELVDQMITAHDTRKLPAVCAYCHRPALYDPLTVRVVRRIELRLVAGFLMWRPPPRGSPA